MRKKRDLWILLIVLSFCALLVVRQTRHPKMAPSALDDPRQIVIETRYSQPWQEKIYLYQGQTQVLELPEAFEWESGDKARKVFDLLGPPQFTAEFVGSEYYLWERDVRYDWDLEGKSQGRYLAVNFSYGGRISSASLYQQIPAIAKPWGDRRVEDLLLGWED